MKLTWAVVGWVSVLFDAVSAVACLWLVWKLRSAERRRLLPMQLVNLARADLLYTSVQVAKIVLDRYSQVHPSALWLDVLRGVEMLGMWASLILEVHIAAGFLALFWRLLRLMTFLRRTLLLSWVFAAVLVVADPSTRGGGSHNRTIHNDFLHYGYVAALIVTALLYIVAWFRSCWFPLREERRAYKMVWLYPATFSFTMAPTVVCIAFNLDQRLSDPFSALNGLLNVLLYSCHSRFSSAVWCRMGDQHRTSMALWAGVSSLPVGFSMHSPSEVAVTAVQRSALEESERETANMEKSRADLTVDL